MNFKNTFLYLAILLLFNTNLRAESPSNWTDLYADNDIKIEYKYTNCEYDDRYNQEFVILQIINLTNKNLTVSWNNQSWYDNKCVNCDEDRTDESYTEVMIDANQILTGDCSTQNNLRIFSKFSDSLENMPGIKKIVELTKFKLQNINISYE